PPRTNPHPFPTRRSSDLDEADLQVTESQQHILHEAEGDESGPTVVIPTWAVDRAEHKVELANRRLEREGIAERFELERKDGPIRSDEHTSELQSRFDLVC